MRVVVQRVKSSSVVVDSEVVGKIGKGLMVLVGVAPDDTVEDVEWLAKKIVNMRIFADDNDIMNRSLLDIDGEVLVISQFTLHAKTKKGNRPSYINAAKPDISIPLYEKFKEVIESYIKHPIQSGIFGADMALSLINDGPVTITIDSKAKE